MINWANFVSQLFNGLALGALLALISSGLTIIYGTLGVLNLAHGAMFMLGGYAGYVAFTYTDSFVVAVIAGSLFVMIVGIPRAQRIMPDFAAAGTEDHVFLVDGDRNRLGKRRYEVVFWKLEFGSRDCDGQA